MDDSSSLFHNLRELYRQYGGLSSVLISGYSLVAMIATVLSWRLVMSEQWTDRAIATLPTIIGFSIAAYALMFAMLDEKSRGLLRAPSPALKGRSPLMALVSSIPHSMIVQSFGFLFAIIYASKPFPLLPELKTAGLFLNGVLSFIGTYLFYYGLLLVLAASLSIFTLIGILTKPSKAVSEAGAAKESDSHAD